MLAHGWCCIAVDFPIAFLVMNCLNLLELGTTGAGQLTQCPIFMKSLACFASWCEDAVCDVPDLFYGKDSLD